MAHRKDAVLGRMRRDAFEIFQAGLRSVDPEKAVSHHLRVEDGTLRLGEQGFPLDRFQRVLVVGAGKAACPMARALEGMLGGRISGGAVVVKEGHGLPLERIEVFEAGHPIPDDRGVRGTRAVISWAEAASSDDLVICLISGGGSALLVAPASGVGLEDKRQTTKLLLECGATIHEINAVRKHLSRVKGGRLARLAHPATVLSLILSDVVGNDLDVIASGPTVPDSSTFGRAERIFHRYGIWDRLPAAVRRHIQLGLAGEVEETPKRDDPAFRGCHHRVVGDNFQALLAARQRAEEVGYRPMILSSSIEGETREVACVHAAILREVLATGNPLEPPACILSGGETTVTLRDRAGVGGRNQEFALATALALEGITHAVVLSCGTDGTDGPTDAAGAVADGHTCRRGRSMGLDPESYLTRNDSYDFFKSLGDLIITGPTRTNVMDIRVLLAIRP